MNLAKAPKQKPIAQAAQREEISPAARASAQEELKRKKGFRGTSLAGETGGFTGFAGTTQLT